MSALPPESVRPLLHGAILSPGFRRATFGGAARGAATPWVKVVVRPVEVRGARHLQFSYFDGKKTLTKNCLPGEAAAPLDELVAVAFSGVHVAAGAEEIDLRTTKKGQVTIGRRKAEAPGDTAVSHNRVKDVPLPEGRADRLLEVLGIAAADGRVKPTMRAKFTQINEFLKHLTHVLDDAGLRTLGGPIEILDAGCGASYLTFAAHHYLNDVLNLPARILGVDVNDDLVRKSATKADELGATGLSFACGRIGRIDAPADIVLALHACDTATDDALAQAVRSEAKLILSVPCCHHHLNAALRPDGPAGVLRPLLRHGILRERAADLFTDAFRALALRVLGYRTDVVEFVSPEHTARNLMIRAVRGLPTGEEPFVAEYRELRRFVGAAPYIETVLGPSFASLVVEPTAPVASSTV